MVLTLGCRYEELPETGKPFEGQRIAVLGSGNAGFETANALAVHAAYVHMWAARLPLHGVGERDKHDFLAWESRYVGNVRALNVEHLDAYLLNSLDIAGGGTAVLNDPLIVPCGTGRKLRCLFQRMGKYVPCYAHVGKQVSFRDRKLAV